MQSNNLTVPVAINGTNINLQFEGRYYFDRNFDTTFPCVYLIVSIDQFNSHKIIYVGVTQDINQRMLSHHKMESWKKYVNSHSLYILKNSNEQERLLIESLIIEQYNPPCNDK